MSPRPEDGRARIFMLAEKDEDLREEPFREPLSRTAELGDLIPHGRLPSADVISLIVRNPGWAEETARNIRAQPALFLKPLVTLSEFRLETIDDIVDDEIILPVAGESLDRRFRSLLSISERIAGLTSIPERPESDRHKEILALRYLLTRDGAGMKPVRDLASPFGYTYPQVGILLGVEPGEEIELLAGLEQASLIRGTLTDRIHLCPFCRHFQVNYRETCPECRSIRIREERTIHHFRCAYVGVESEFREGSGLRCPKCGRVVRHIGVDYDRPAADLWCRECSANFVEPGILGYCLNCTRSFPPENALPMLIQEYALTKEGARAAEEGILPEPGLTAYLKKEFGFYPFEIFKEFLRVEIERCRRNPLDSTLGRVRIRNLRDIVEEGGLARAHRLREEIAILFREMLRESDILTEQGQDEILVILTHTDVEQAEIALRRVRDKGARQFRRRIEFEHTFLPLRGVADGIDEVLEQVR